MRSDNADDAKSISPKAMIEFIKQYKWLLLIPFIVVGLVLGLCIALTPPYDTLREFDNQTFR